MDIRPDPETPRLLVQLSDTHIKEPGRLAYGRVDTAAGLSRAIADVRRQPRPVEAVLITGDLVDSGRAEQYLHLKALLAPLACPVYLVAGNHDDRAALRAAFPEHHWLQQGEFVQYAVDLDGLRLVVLDSSVPGRPHGALCGERLAWLEQTLAQAPRQPTIVAIHHPPFPTFVGWMDRFGLLEGREALAAVLARHPQVQRVVSGHMHRSIHAQCGGVVAMTVPSTAHQLYLDFGPEAAKGYTDQAAGYAIHAWAPRTGVVSHVTEVSESPGPHPFYDANGKLIDS